MSNSKKKGNRGELEICKKLTKHFDLNFSRVPTSGAFSTTHNLTKNAHKYHAGDIICPDNFSFSIENKFGYEIDLYNLFKEKHNEKDKFFSFLSQSETDANKTENLIPMVIYTRTRKKPLVCLPLENNSKENDIAKHKGILSIYLVIVNDATKWIVADLDEVLSKFPKDFFFSEVKNGT
jgi:hypothetical protein